MTLAAPSPTVEERDPSPAILAKRATCTPTTYGNSQLDDTPYIEAAFASCGNGGVIVIPAGTTYSIRSMLTITPCTNCDFQIEGTLKSSTDYTYWSTQPAIIYVNGVKGAKIHSVTGSGVIDGDGQSSYDAYAVSTFARPTLIYVVGASSEVTVSGLTLKNPPNAFIAQKTATSLTYSSLTMTAASKSTNLPKNTDGFDIGQSTYTTIKNVYISNQDDCIAFKSGANYVTVDTVTCAGTNHGTVVGSLGQSNADYVSNIYVTNLDMINCGKAAGIKLYAGGPDFGTATVTNVTWDTVTVDGCEYGVQIQSCYNNDATYCAEYPSAAVLEDIYFKNFKGTTNTQVEPDVANIDCPGAGTCDIYFTNWNVVSPSGKGVNLCANIDSSPGITCTSGASG
ncbi:glycoside hydrolase family 28 protein [Xylariales sp. PMI_506]|nr:glycoside hydrolase family 28 protein [Xylariales sp. PMI_506]